MIFAWGLLALGAVRGDAMAAEKAASRPFADADHVAYALARGAAALPVKANLSNHGGPVITSAKVVFLFWGPTFSNPASPDYAYAHTLQAYRDQLGTTPEYNVITQYSGILLANLGTWTADGFDSSTPPPNVTDAMVQSKISTYLMTYPANAGAIYEVVLPASSYSSSGSTYSCGGPHHPADYCAYHGFFGKIRYSVQPFPSCGDCQVPGFSNVQNQERFVCHETRTTVTDPFFNAWWDGTTGKEADEKCASSTPFLGTNGYAYPYEWSNLTGSCVRTR
jgi:hypothetical protein